MTTEQTQPDLRNTAFKTKSKDFLGADGTHEDAIWGIIMEISYPEGSLSLLSRVDGTASLFFSNGGGVIGSEEHEHIAGLSSAIASGSGVFFSEYAEPTKDFPLPEAENVQFFFMSDSQILKTGEFSENDLGEDLLPLSPLFHAMHMLIAQIQEVEEE